MRIPGTFVVRYLRKRRKKRRTPILKLLLLLSALLLYLPSQIGITYGEFASTSEAAVTFSACRVFPEEIESRLSQVHVHIKNASANKTQLQSFNASSIRIPTSTSFTPAPTAPLSHEPFFLDANIVPASAAPYTTATSATYRDADMDSFNYSNQKEHESAAEFISLQIALLQEAITAVNDQLTANTTLLQKITHELESGASLLNDVIQQIRDKPVNCAKFSQSTLLDETEKLLNQDHPLSPSFYASMADLMEYLRQVYDAGIAIQNVPNSLTNQLSLEESNFRTLFEAKGYAASPELLQYYHDLQSSLEAQKQAIFSEIRVLDSRLADIKIAVEPEVGSVDYKDSVAESGMDEALEMESHIQDE